MTAYERGWNAAEQGLALRHNPYARGTEYWVEWRDGWRELNASWLSTTEVRELIRVQA
jgi:hypothetical protein